MQKTVKNIIQNTFRACRQAGILSALVFASCGKPPQASFTISNTNPWPGQVVTLTNTSTNTLDQTWEIDVGVFSTQESPEVIYPTSGQRTIHLTVYKRNRKSYADQVINVRQAGKVIFWTNQTNWVADGGYPIDVTVGTTTRTVTNYITVVDCENTTNSAVYQLAPGTYPYTAAQQSPGIMTWSGNITITDGGCANVHL